MFTNRVFGVLTVSALLSSIAVLSCQAQPAASVAPTKASGAQAPGASAPPPTTAPAPTSAQAAPAAPTPAPEVLKVGILASLTGPSERMGSISERFTRMGIDDVNAKGGITLGGKKYLLQALPTVDDKGTSEGGREGANKLVLADKVKYVLDTISTPAAGAQAITEPNKVVMLAYTALDKSLSPNFPYTIQIGTSHIYMRMYALWDMLAQDSKVRRVALMFPDDPTGRGLIAATVEYSKVKGLEIVSQDFYPTDLKDFTPLVTRVLRSNPDAVDVGPAAARGPLFLAQMKALSQANYKGFVFGVSSEVKAMTEVAGFWDGFTTGMLTDFKSDLLQPVEKDVISRYAAKYSWNEVEAFPIGNWNTPLLLKQAIEKAGTFEDTTKVIDVLRNGTWDTMYGQKKFVGVKTFGLPSVLQQPIYLAKTEKGKLVTSKAMEGNLP